MQTKLVSDLGAGQRAWQVLLVGEDEEHGVAKLFLSKHLVEFLAVLLNSLSIIGVNDIDEALGVGVVMSPEKSDLVLTTDIPHVERDVLVLDRLDVEADGGDGVDDLTELELVEDGRLACSIEANHENTHLTSADHALPDFTEKGSHSVCVFIFFVKSNFFF